MEEHVHGFTPGHCQHGLFPELATNNFPLSQTRSYQVRVTYRPFYTQTLLHTEAFTHRSFYTQKLLHTDTFAHKHFHTQKLLHTNTFTHRDRTCEVAILLQFLTFNIHFVRKGCDGPSKIATLPRFLTSNLHFACKGCP